MDKRSKVHETSSMTDDLRSAIKCEDINALALYIDSADAFTTFGISGNYGCRFHTANGKSITVFVKIALHARDSYYHWQDPPDGVCPSVVEVEINIMRAILREIILKNRSPHFAEIIAVSTCKNVAKHIIDLASCDRQQYGQAQMIPGSISSLMCGFNGLIADGYGTDRFSIIFSSYCQMSFRDFIAKHLPPTRSEYIVTLDTLVFQILYSLLVIHRVWPNFRHGDLLTHNIMMEIDTIARPRDDMTYYLQYQIGEKSWYFPYRGYLPKIIDFGHGEIPEENIISPLHTPTDKWVPDHIMFILSFIDTVQGVHEFPTKLTNILNHANLTLHARNNVLIDHISSFIRLEDLDRIPYFNSYTKQPPAKQILHTYTAPDSRE